MDSAAQSNQTVNEILHYADSQAVPEPPAAAPESNGTDIEPTAEQGPSPAEPESSVESQQGGDAGAEELQPYTPEEIREASRQGWRLDPRRLPPEMQALYKELQADYTRKTQQLAEMRKALESQLEAQVSDGGQPQDIEQLLRVDPQRALSALDRAIAGVEQRLDEAVNNDDLFGSQKLGRQLDRLRQYRQTAAAAAQIKAHVENWFANTFPDFSDLAPATVQYLKTADPAVQFTDEELSYLTSPAVMGPLAYKLAGFFVNLYKRHHMPPTNLEQKARKPAPPRTSAPTAASQKSSASQSRIHAARQRALQSGSVDDWAQYIDALTSH